MLSCSARCVKVRQDWHCCAAFWQMSGDSFMWWWGLRSLSRDGTEFPTLYQPHVETRTRPHTDTHRRLYLDSPNHTESVWTHALLIKNGWEVFNFVVGLCLSASHLSTQFCRSQRRRWPAAPGSGPWWGGRGRRSSGGSWWPERIKQS